MQSSEKYADEPFLTSLVELQFLPSVYYLAMISMHDAYQIEQWENYNKGSFRNKCLINSNDQNQYVIIPLQKGKHRSQSIRDVKISYDTDWIRPLKHRFQTEWSGLPYYAYYIDELHSIIEKKWTFLFELNSHLFKYVLDSTGLQHPAYTTHYQSKTDRGLLDLRDRINPRFFRDHPELMIPIELEYFMFVPAHSIVECLFMYGPETERAIHLYKRYLSTQQEVLL